MPHLSPMSWFLLPALFFLLILFFSSSIWWHQFPMISKKLYSYQSSSIWSWK
uniref:ATP synthase F0 subunit 8 n=1 Tax=Diopatra cuprea TaxID=398472 RepID=UPI001D108CA7|nr:ATP synthase F0 subunit 8 [Diopatra cuprea]QZM06622.1 ATP synthase F0 subunit 8 [Diopatra cuprea]